MARTQLQSPDIAPGAVNPSKLQPSGVVGGTYSYIQALTINSTGLITGAVSGRLSYSPNQISPGFALGDLLDTSPSSSTNGQVLVYRSGKWVNESPDFAGITDHGALTGLSDDDHIQYLTSPRANAWLATKTTTNLTEGSSLYFTNERAQDAVGSALTNSSTVRFTYNDGSNTISADVSPANVSHSGLAGLTSGDPHTQYQLRSEKNANSGYLGLTSGGLVSPARLGPAPASGKVLYGDNTWASPSAAGVTDHGALTGLGDDDHTQYLTSPRADSWLATKSTSNLTEGSNLYFTDERAQDAVGSVLTNSSSIAFTYDDSGNTITAAVSPAGISHNSLSGLTTADPHTQYQLRSERNTSNGYLGLTSTGLVSPARLGASPAAGEVLYGNNVWSSPRLNNMADLRLGFVAPLANRHHLIWNTGQQKWINELYETTLDSASDIEIVSPSTGQILLYEEGTWYNVSPSLVDHGAFGGLSDNDHPQYQLVSSKNSAGGYPGLDAAGRLSPSRGMYAYRYVHVAYEKADSNATQDWFSPNPGITLSPGIYEFFGMLRLGKGTGSVGFNFLFDGTATYSIAYAHFGQAAAEGSQGTAQTTGHRITTTAATGAPAGTNTTIYGYALGTIYVTATGTVRPQYALSGASSGAVTVRQGTFWRAHRHIDSPAAMIGTWA